MERFPCDPNAECALRDTVGCKEDVHHKYWPRRNYKDQVSKQFRNLDENKELTCRSRHQEIHATEPVPKKPSRETMIRAIGGVSIEGVA